MFRKEENYLGSFKRKNSEVKIKGYSAMGKVEGKIFIFFVCNLCF